MQHMFLFLFARQVSSSLPELTDGVYVGDVIHKVPPAQVDGDLAVGRALLENASAGLLALRGRHDGQYGARTATMETLKRGCACARLAISVGERAK